MIPNHSVVNRPVSAYVQFADACNRRFEIADAMAAYVNGKDPRYKIKASHDHVLPGPDTMEADGLWIDDPDYDPDEWVMRRKAYRGDGEAMFRLAEKIDLITNPNGAYVAYLMAKNCLPPGKLRIEAEKRAKETVSAMAQHFKDQFDHVLELNRKLSDRVGLPCRP